MPQVDFYVLDSSEPQQRLQFCARLAEKAIHNGLKVFVLAEDQPQGNALSQLLWQLRPDAFLPSSTEVEPGHPIQINTAPSLPQDMNPAHCLFINLDSSIPELHQRFQRVAEVVIQAEPVLSTTRSHYLEYKRLGVTPVSHKIHTS